MRVWYHLMHWLCIFIAVCIYLCVYLVSTSMSLWSRVGFFHLSSWVGVGLTEYPSLGL